MTQRNISGVCFLFCLVVTFATGQPLLRPAGGRDSILRPNAQISSFTRSVWLDENRLRILLNNRGELDYNTPHDGGAYWPDTTNTWRNVVVFDCGPWVVGKLAGQPKLGFSQWGSSYSPGPVIEGKAAMIARPVDSLRYRPYKVANGDSPLTNPDYREWPVDLGAPLDAEGKPRIYGDQTVWTVYNNLDPNVLPDWWKAHMALPAPESFNCQLSLRHRGSIRTIQIHLTGQQQFGTLYRPNPKCRLRSTTCWVNESGPLAREFGQSGTTKRNSKVRTWRAVCTSTDCMQEA